MAKLNRKQIHSEAYRALEAAPEGLRWTDLVDVIHVSHPETPRNSVRGGLQALLSTAEDIQKIARGTYRLSRYEPIGQDNEEVGSADGQATGPTPLNESDFYGPFADWLVEVADEATRAVSLGGSLLRGKWGTPDVVGVLKPRPQDILKFEPQIISAELKIDPNQPVVAFGQAVAYRLFSHKSYIVLPRFSTEEDLARLKALCTLHGIGLVLFDLDVDRPDFTTIVLPVRGAPDMFYANNMVKRLLEASKHFEDLF